MREASTVLDLGFGLNPTVELPLRVVTWIAS